jgi:hypothetical protein
MPQIMNASVTIDVGAVGMLAQPASTVRAARIESRRVSIVVLLARRARARLPRRGLPRAFLGTEAERAALVRLCAARSTASPSRRAAACSEVLEPAAGFYRLHVTDATWVVWLTTDRGLVGLSPQEPDAFVGRLRDRLGRAA